jgi:hypothetical protein
MSKARLLADLLRDEKISLSEISGETSTSDFNKDEATYENENSLRVTLQTLEDDATIALAGL